MRGLPAPRLQGPDSYSLRPRWGYDLSPVYASAERTANWGAATFSVLGAATLVATAVWLRPPLYFWPEVTAISVVYGWTRARLTGMGLRRRVQDAPWVPWESIAARSARHLLPALATAGGFALLMIGLVLVWHSAISLAAMICGGNTLWMVLSAGRMRAQRIRGTVLLLGPWADEQRWFVSELPAAGGPSPV